MAISVEIACIKRSNRTGPHERLLSVGGITSNGKKWRLSVADAIAVIERGEWEFHVVVDGKSKRVIVASYNGIKYLNTEVDRIQPNSLLALPECS